MALSNIFPRSFLLGEIVQIVIRYATSLITTKIIIDSMISAFFMKAPWIWFVPDNSVSFIKNSAKLN